MALLFNGPTDADTPIYQCLYETNSTEEDRGLLKCVACLSGVLNVEAA